MIHRLTRTAVLAGLMGIGIVGSGLPCAAAIDMFLKITGVPGGSTVPGHVGEIEISSIQFNVSNAGSASAGTGSGTGKSLFSDVTFSKTLDKSSAALMTNCITGRRMLEAQLTMRAAGKNQGDFYKVKMSDVVVTGFSMITRGESPLESISINFAKVNWEYHQQKQDGTLQLAGQASWDTKTLKGAAGLSSGPGAGAPGAGEFAGIGKSPFFSNAAAILARPRGISSPSIFAKVTGIEGESRDQKHANEIDISIFQFGMSNPFSGAFEGGGGAGRVNLLDISATKALDKASLPLTLACASGKSIPEVILSFVKAGATRPEFLRITLRDVLVSSYAQSTSSSGDMPLESFSMNFARMDLEYFEQDARGVMIPMGKVAYDVRNKL